MSKYVKQTDVLRIIDTYYGPHTTYHKIRNLPTVEYEPVVHGQWIEQHFGTLIPIEYDDTGNVIVHDCINYQCSLCGRTESKKEPYCNCGAKMDGE